MPVNIQLEWTPNPSTLKYVVNRSLLSRGAVNFTTREEADQGSPLASKLMGIEGVVGVMIGTQFVTVTKGEQGEWDVLNDSVMAALDEHLGADQPVLAEDWQTRAQGPSGTANDSEAEKRIREILDAEIRPAVQGDGGDILLDRYEGGVAYMHMRGSCSGCPSSTATLKMGIESRLREVIPELLEVVAV
jgi:Fe-S cluster biogenesis protein NfuA